MTPVDDFPRLSSPSTYVSSASTYQLGGSKKGKKRKIGKRRRKTREERGRDVGEDPGSADKEGIVALLAPELWFRSEVRSGEASCRKSPRQGAACRCESFPSFCLKRARKLAAGIYLALAGSLPPSFPRGGSFPGTRAPR